MGKAGQGDVCAAHGEGDAAGGAEAQAADEDHRRDDEVRDLVRSTLFSTTFRTPTAEIIPYRMKLTPPTMAVGMEFDQGVELGGRRTG